MIVGLLAVQVLHQAGQIQQLTDALHEKEIEPSNTLNRTILIGVTAATSDDYYKIRPFVEDFIEPDTNQYSADHGYNTTFEFVLTSNNGDSASANLNTQMFHHMGVTVIIGHPWNSQSCASLSYAEAHDMILISPAASAVSQSIPGDSYLRLACNDTVHFMVAAKALLSYGVNACVAVGIDFGYGLYEAFEEEYERGGGVVLDWVKLDFDDYDLDSLMGKIEAEVLEGVETYGDEGVAVLLMGFTEMIPLVERADEHPVLYTAPWFGCWGMGLNAKFIEEAPEESAHLKIFTPVPAPPESEEYTAFNMRYEKLGYPPLGFEMACTYDAAMIAVRAILESRSTDDEVLLETIPEVAARTQGVSGSCALNADGDREISDFLIWGYGTVQGRFESIPYGRYVSATDTVNWDWEALASESVVPQD